MNQLSKVMKIAMVRLRAPKIRQHSTSVLITCLISLVLSAGAFAADTESIGSSNRTLASSDAQVIELIDSQLSANWDAFDLKPSKTESDGTWCRRVFLDLIGRLPTFDELSEFAKDRSPEKRLHLVDRLMGDRYVEEYANHWSSVWTNILIGRSGGTERNSLTNRPGMQKYLRDHFARNKPYDKMVYELITASGTNKPGTENFNGAVNFLAMKVNMDNGTQATSAVSKTFLGLQVQCTQCHNHPFNQWKQQKFWEFNAFFRQTRSLRRFEEGTRNVDHIELVDEDYRGESRRIDEADLFYQLRNGLTKVAYPVFVDGTEIQRSGYVEEVNRRRELGQLVLKSPFLGKMIVNRMWAHFLGYGFTKPIDDLGPHNPPSSPELLDQLAVEFKNSGYDMKKLMRWITLSQPYQLSSKSTKYNESDDPKLGETPRFSHFYSRQMSPEQLYQSIVKITGADRRGSLEEQQAQRDRWLQQFVVAFGTDDGAETSTFNGSIPQSLMMFNGDLVKRATSVEQGSWLYNLYQSDLKAKDKVNRLFLNAVARKANSKELKAMNQLTKMQDGNQLTAMQDMWWAILNSNEFITIH